MIIEPGPAQSGPSDWAVPSPRPLDLAGWLRRRQTAPPAEARVAAGAEGTALTSSASLESASGQRETLKFPPTATSVFKEGRESRGEASSRRPRRAASYLAKLPPAVSGQRGHDRTFHAACVLVKGFGLTIDEARPLLRDWNQGCVPPWSPAELEHKLKSADAAPDDRPRGYLADPDREPPRRGGTPLPRSRAAAAPLPPADGPSEPNGPDEAPPCLEGQEANPHRLAGLFLHEQFANGGGIGLRFWRDEFHSWDGSSYRRAPIGEIRAQLSQFLAREFDRLYRQELAGQSRGPVEGGVRSPSRKPPRPRPIPVTSRLVGDVLQAVAGLVLVRAADCPRQPAWLDGPSASSEPPPWPADEVLPARNALVHLPSFAEGARCALAPSPRFFNAFALDYDFDPAAPEPAAWLAFLNQVWGDDPESIACLQEWFGYLLTADTRQQKILMMVGPKRSGRGTIARVLKALAGANNVVNPTLATLARPFGLSALIDKPIAIFPDARLSSRPDNAAIVECLLSISGEDDQTVDRKHLPAWTGRLPTRFVLISNELPRLKDASGALSSRLILLRFTRSFFDREDTGLYGRLSRELPGILLWAVAGWERLRRRGRFVQPGSARDLVAAMDELASPIAAFLQDRCVLAPRESVPVAELYEAWRSWCQEHGRDAVGDEPSFGRDLHAAIPGLSKSRHRRGPTRIFLYNGIRLRTPFDPDPDAGEPPPDAFATLDSGQPF